MKTIYFDMDGTIADLYSVDNWLGKITSDNCSPYQEAKPLVDVPEFESLLLKLKNLGYNLGIVTWGSKSSNEEFLEKVGKVKKEWVKKYFPNINFDEFVVLDYSCNKTASVRDPFGILFDDSELIRHFWPGESYGPEKMIDVLNKLLEVKNERD